MNNPRGTSRRVFDAYNAHDLEALRALYALAARTHRTEWPASGGVDEILTSAQMDMVAFPDLHIEPQLPATEDGGSITVVRITGTNTGEIALGDFGRAAAATTAGAVDATKGAPPERSSRRT